MKHAVKYLLILFLLFVTGALMLGLFNPNLEVKSDIEFSRSKQQVWDYIIDTSHWVEMDTTLISIDWISGYPGREGTEWTEKTDWRKVEDQWTCTISSVIKDSSLVVIRENGKGFRERRNVLLSFSNGKTHLVEKSSWHGDAFFDRIKIALKQSSLEKAAELRLKKIKWLLVGDAE